MSSENWPSSTDCLRAWGWLEAKERESVRAREEGTSGDVGAALEVSSQRRARFNITHYRENWVFVYIVPMRL